MSSRVLSDASVIAMTGHGMFGFYDDDGDRPEPEHSHGWFAATPGVVHVNPRCQLPEPGIRFELWTGDPALDVTDEGDQPEVRARLTFRVRTGSIGLTAVEFGTRPDVFDLPRDWYHLELLGYRRSVMATVEKDLYARGIAPGDDEWERAKGTELYVARFWPQRALTPTDPPGEESSERIEAIRAWAMDTGLKVNERGPIPAAVIAMYDATH
jgi:Lsr2